MGWASGSRIMNEIIGAVQPHVADQAAREAIYRPIIDALEDSDWDTQDESMGLDPAFDAVLRGMHPDWFEYDEGSA